MESLARKVLKRPLEITVGGRSVVAQDVAQIVEVREDNTKFVRLLEILGQQYNDDPDARTLIFVDRQEAADNLLRDLIRKGYPCMSLHGGKVFIYFTKKKNQINQPFYLYDCTRIFNNHCTFFMF